MEQEQIILYDESILRSFVFESATKTETENFKEVDSIMMIASKDSIVFCKTVSFFENAYGYPSSSYRNEKLYTKVLEAKMNCAWYAESDKTKVRERMSLIQQNQVGHSANDFVYLTADGTRKRLYDTDATNTLIFFYNPECDACNDMMIALIASKVINEKMKHGKMKILAIYIDKDEKLWLDHLSEMPEDWTHGRDDGEYLYKYNVYDLRAIPTLYMLDKDKKVLLKDCISVGVIEEKLRQM